MKSSRALLPILIIVLLVCMMALTFAWFSQTMENVRAGNTFTIGDTNIVDLSDAGKMLSDKYNGELGFREDGTAYPAADPDATYVAEYHLGVYLQGDRDMTLRFTIDSVTIVLGENVTKPSAERVLASKISEFVVADGDEGTHIGTAVKEGEQWNFQAPADGSTAFLYTTDGTENGSVVAIALDSANAQRYFALTVAKYDPESGAHGDAGQSVTFSLADGEVSAKLESATEQTVCLSIAYGFADEDGTGRPFLFADNYFKSSDFRFAVTATAE